jgi:hypothetical protein
MNCKQAKNNHENLQIGNESESFCPVGWHAEDSRLGLRYCLDFLHAAVEPNIAMPGLGAVNVAVARDLDVGF